jgi:hypothetical protein
VIDLRVWRIALLAVPAALIVAMFSLEDVPDPLQGGLPPDAFDGDAATSLTKDLARSAPDPRPGSDADSEIAELVQSRFTSIPSAEVSEQTFDASFGGEDVTLRNLIVVIPGKSDRQIAVIAQRDAADGSGAVSSIASTAAMLEIASGFTASTHEKTLVFVSTDGDSIGALGTRRFIRDYTDAGLLDVAVVISQPGASDHEQPLMIPWSNGPQSTGATLAQTAATTVAEEVGEPAGDEGPLDDIFRLALPAAFGGQGPLIEDDVDAVRFSSSGELPLTPDRDQLTELNPETLDRFGRATLALMLALDAAPSPLEHGPDAYVGLAGNLLPGWTLSLLALALLAPLFVVSLAGLATSAHSPVEAAKAVGWVALRSVPFLAGLAFVYAFSVVGLIPSPEFPFDPRVEDLGRGGAIGVAVATLATGAVAFLLRPLLPPPPGLATCAPAAAVAVAALAGLGVWSMNPYLALVVAIGLQAWVLAAAGIGQTRLGTAGLVAAGLVPVLAALVDLAGRFEAGPSVLSDLTMMFTGGQLGGRLVMIGCVLIGVALALLAISGPAPAAGTPQLKFGALVARGRELEERRAARRGRSARRSRRGDRPERPRQGTPEPEVPAPPELEPEADPEAGEDEPEEPAIPERPEEEPLEDGGPDQSEPPRDPRMWSKPAASIGVPSPSARVPAVPSVTRPIRVRLWPASSIAFAAAATRSAGRHASSS